MKMINILKFRNISHNLDNHNIKYYLRIKCVLCVCVLYLFVPLDHIGWFLVSLKIALGYMYSFAALCFCLALFPKSVECSGGFLRVNIFHGQEFLHGTLERSAGSGGLFIFNSILQSGHAQTQPLCGVEL